MAEQLFQPAANLLPLRLQRFELSGKPRILGMRTLHRLLRRRKLSQCRIFLLTETIDQRDRLLDTVFQMTQSIDFEVLDLGFPVCGSHKSIIDRPLPKPLSPVR
jgi:hypothetical protein